MTLLETTRLIEYIASRQINVNTIIDTENIYNLNTNNYQVKYSAICLQQQRHISNIEGFITYNYNIYYVDRLVLDKSNKLEIQSTGINILQNIINIIKDRVWVSDITTSEYVTFTERFTAECAGVYCSISITTPIQSLCSQYDITGGPDFNSDFGDDFWHIVGGPDFNMDFNNDFWVKVYEPGEFNDDFNDDFWIRKNVTTDNRSVYEREYMED